MMLLPLLEFKEVHPALVIKHYVKVITAGGMLEQMAIQSIPIHPSIVFCVGEAVFAQKVEYTWTGCQSIEGLFSIFK